MRTPTLVDWLILAIVVLGFLYVCVFEVGLPVLRNWLADRRNPRPGYIDRTRLP